MKSTISLRALALAGAGMALVPSGVLAQDEDATQPTAEEQAQAADGSAIGAFDVIVVTGTKTQNAEDVQDVPVAVTAFNAQSLEALKVRDIQSLTYSAPSVSLDQVGTSRGDARFR